MRTYLAPIGYHSTRVTRPVLSNGLDTDDEVVLLRPTTEADNAQASEAVGDVERLLEEIVPAVSSRVERITSGDVTQAMFDCSELIRDADGNVILIFSGGPREILIPFATAGLLHSESVETTFLFGDIDGGVHNWDLPHLTATIPTPTRPTLRAIAASDGSVSIPELTDRTEQAKSTVTRHVTQLNKNGLVETTKDGKTKYVTLTVTGKLLLRREGLPE